MTTMSLNNEKHYQATVGLDTVVVDFDLFYATVAELSQSYFDHGMRWADANAKACHELLEAETWMSAPLYGKGVTIARDPQLEEWQAKIEELVRDDLITREPIWNQGIAVKYLKDEYQPIALAELDRQGK